MPVSSEHYNSLQSQLASLRLQLAAVTAERDRLREACEQIANGFRTIKTTENGGWLPNWTGEDAARFDLIAREALAATEGSQK